MAKYFREEGLVTDSDPIVGAQENAGDPHYIPSADRHRPIKPNEILLLDLWGKLPTPGAVYADITWVGFTGDVVPEPFAKAFATIAAGRDAAIQKVQAGVAAGAAVQVTRRVLVLPVITDTQAGFKGFTAEWAGRVFDKTLVDGFAFDIEVLYLARRMGARIAEMPVSVEFRDDSTFDVGKHLPPFIEDIWRIRMNSWRGRYS